MAYENKVVDLTSLRIQGKGSFQNSQGTESKKRLAAYIIIVVIVLAVGITLLYNSGAIRPAEKVEVGEVNLVYPSQANAVLVASGYIVAQRKAAVASKGTGRLEYLGVIEGDRVQKGSVIGRLESSDVEAVLGQSKANLDVSKANYNNAKAELEDASSNFDRQKKLYDQNSISKADYDAATARYKRALASVASSEAQIKMSEAGVRSAEVAVENTVIRAPFDGTVLTKTADVGEVISPFGAASGSRGAIVTLADMSSLEVEADVSESNIERIYSGQPCEITLDAYPDKRYRGSVHKIVPTADRSKATVLTKVRFDERDERVLPEMRAKVNFLSKESAKEAMSAATKISVPAPAVVTRGGKKVVFVVRNETVKETVVELGEILGTGIEVKYGLHPGDKVVLRPSEKITDGVSVKQEK